MMSNTYFLALLPSVLSIVYRENIAICLGNFGPCHDYVESLLRSDLSSGGNGSEISEASSVASNLRSSSAEELRRLEAAPTDIRQRALIPYLDFCAAPNDDVLAFLETERLCRWGYKQEHVPLSIDRHVYGLSHFANGKDQILDGGLPVEDIVPYMDAALELCNQMQDVSMAVYHHAVDSNDAHVSTELEFSLDLPGLRQLAPMGDAVIEEAGGKLSVVLAGHHNLAKNILADANARSLAVVCPEGGTRTPAEVHLLAVAVQLSMQARFFMVNVRTNIALKMLWLEVGGVHAQQTGMVATVGMLPRYQWRQIAYGRHWDMLDALLLNRTRTGGLGWF